MSDMTENEILAAAWAIRVRREKEAETAAALAAAEAYMTLNARMIEVHAVLREAIQAWGEVSEGVTPEQREGVQALAGMVRHCAGLLEEMG